MQEEESRPVASAAPAAEPSTASAEPSTAVERYPKKKYAVIFGYCGAGYCGLQHNSDPTHPTVEHFLLVALHKAHLIADENLKGVWQQKIAWQRASRTDKGVHALRNVLSVKLICLPEGEVEMAKRANEFLPNDIRIYLHSAGDKQLQ